MNILLIDTLSLDFPEKSIIKLDSIISVLLAQPQCADNCLTALLLLDNLSELLIRAVRIDSPDLRLMSHHSGWNGLLDLKRSMDAYGIEKSELVFVNSDEAQLLRNYPIGSTFSLSESNFSDQEISSRYRVWLSASWEKVSRHDGL